MFFSPFQGHYFFNLMLCVVTCSAVAIGINESVQAGSLKKTYVNRINYAHGCDNAANGCVLVTFSSNMRNAPACQRRSNRMIVDPNGPGAPVNHAELLRVLERAHQHRMPVQVNGFGTCALHGNTETLRSVRLLDWVPPKPVDGADGRHGKDGKNGRNGRDGKPASRVVGTCTTFVNRFTRGACRGDGELISKTTGLSCSVAVEGGYGCTARVNKPTEQTAICCAYRVK